MANVTQWLNDLDTTSKQTSRSFVLVPIDFSYMTSYRLSIGPSNLILLYGRTVYPQFTDDDRLRRTQHYCSISATVSNTGRLKSKNLGKYKY